MLWAPNFDVTAGTPAAPAAPPQPTTARGIRRRGYEQALAAGLDERAARYAGRRAEYWWDWHDRPAETAIHWGIRDGRVHARHREIAITAAAHGGR